MCCRKACCRNGLPGSLNGSLFFWEEKIPSKLAYVFFSVKFWEGIEIDATPCKLIVTVAPEKKIGTWLSWKGAYIASFQGLYMLNFRGLRFTQLLCVYTTFMDRHEFPCNLIDPFFMDCYKTRSNAILAVQKFPDWSTKDVRISQVQVIPLKLEVFCHWRIHDWRATMHILYINIYTLI